MPARKARFGYGYGETHDDLVALRNINVPPKMKCHFCNKTFNKGNYSQKQLDDVRLQIKKNGSISKNPRCNKCTGGRIFEYDCIICKKTGGDEMFSKTQRKNPEDAKCYECVEKQVNQAPVNEDDYEDPNRAFLTGDHHRGKYPDYFAPNSSTPDPSIAEYDQYDSSVSESDAGLNLNDLGEALIEGDFYTPPPPNSNPWKEKGPRSFQTTSKAMSGMTASAASTASQSGVSNNSFTSGSFEHSTSQSSAEPPKKTQWAKIKAYKPAEDQEPDPFSDGSDSDSFDSDDDDDDDDIVI